MFETRKRQSRFSAGIAMAELIFHVAVRHVRKTHSNAFMSILMNMLQVAIFVLAFYFMFMVLGLRGIAIRGDFMVYIMTGIFLYMTHSKTMSAVSGAEGPASPMMQHAPMNTFVAICGAALSALYIQMISVITVLFIYHVLITPVSIYDPIGCIAMILLAWFSGVAIGLVFLAAKPWFPTVVSVLSTVYQRANMIASGKMFVANTLPPYMIVMFDWNPLFHTIDQSRGYAFVNYNPHNSSASYALYFSLVFIMIGLMAEFYTRRQASVSWGART